MYHSIDQFACSSLTQIIWILIISVRPREGRSSGQGVRVPRSSGGDCEEEGGAFRRHVLVEWHHGPDEAAEGVAQGRDIAKGAAEAENHTAKWWVLVSTMDVFISCVHVSHTVRQLCPRILTSTHLACHAKIILIVVADNFSHVPPKYTEISFIMRSRFGEVCSCCS